jgi:uncharacterized membrane protein
MRLPIKQFIRDRRANIAIMSAFSMIVVTGMAALGVDVGNIYADRRKAQSTADLAALMAAGDLPHAANAATAVAQKNAFASSTPINVELVVYVADPARSAAQRFVPSLASAANAVRVTLQTETPLFFGRLLAGRSTFDVRTVATATTTAFASFAIGSRLISLDGGLLNQILGGMLGTTVSLSAMDYQGLINAHVNTFAYMDALAERLSITGTYDTLLSTNARLNPVLEALLDAQRAANGTDSATLALSQMVTAASGSTARVSLGTLVSAGPYGGLTVGQSPKATASVSVFDILTAAARLANGDHLVSANLALNLPGIASATLSLAIGEPPVGTSWVTVGAVGASVHTAQTRLLLTVRLLGGTISAVTLPLYVEVASGTAALDAVTCGSPDISNSTVTLGVTPGVVDAWIGNVSAANMTDFRSAPNPSAATLVNLVGLKVTGRAHATISNSSPTPVSFRYNEIQAQTRKTVTTTSFTSSLLSSLLGDLSLDVSLGGLNLGLPSNAGGAVSSLIATQTAPLDQLLASILATVGVGIGQADVWVSGVRCDRAVLVN